MNRNISAFLVVLVAFLATVSAECPNACSAHGKCGAYDMCTCFRNWMSNDCSERVCQFGLAHVDTPKGDLDASSGALTGPDDVVIVNDAMYPYGTTEQYPATMDIDGNVLTNTAHEYRECSNKGICDRSSGNCACFEGYEGSACQRASCPTGANGVCSGHGTCETISEVAARDYGNVYKLWDEHATMGCVCDGGYEGPDCSQKKCKVGVDPYYLDSNRHYRYSNYSVVFYTKTSAATVSGNYSLIFYDSYGEDWQTEPISWDAQCVDVVNALENLPNNVIPKDSVRCFKTGVGYTADQALLYNVLGSGYSSNWFPRAKYTLAFPENAGKLQQIEINKFLDGSRPTLYTNEDSSTLGWYIYPDGYTGEDVDMVPDRCEDITVTLSAGGDGLTYVMSVDTTEAKLLKKCLGDSNGAVSDNVEVYDWDYGNAYTAAPHNVYTNPHLIKLQEASQYKSAIRTDNNGDSDYDPTLSTMPATTLCNPNKIDAKRFGANRCSNKNPPAFYAVLFFDGTNFRIIAGAGLGQSYTSTAEFFVYTTTGHLQLVTSYSGVYNLNANYTMDSDYADLVQKLYSNELNTYELDNSNGAYTGDISCENNPKGSNGALDCLNKNDYVFFLYARKSTNGNPGTGHRQNPATPNLYQVKKLAKEPKVGTAVYDSEYERQAITLDYSLNTNFGYVRANAASNFGVAYAYKFYPPTNNADGGYKFVSSCSNRGICNADNGVCECFPGFAGDQCSCINANAV